MIKFKRGDQIAYVPDHAQGNLRHEDVEYGFVTSVSPRHVFCRYWRKGHVGELRTVACSESTPEHLLVRIDSVPVSFVTDLLEKIDEARNAS